ncbi:MAG: TetR/AcrR family transcriptional regulator [Desulfobacteraceae bacterium]
MSKKEAILNAATFLFSRKGFKDAGMAEISKMTGAAEGTIFYHFKSKEDLFLSILQRLKEDIVREFEQYLQQSEFNTGLEMLEGVVSFYLSLGSMDDRFLLLHRHEAYELARMNPICKEHLEAIYECLIDVYERAITRGQEDGSMDGDGMSARKTAMILFSMVDGLVRLNTYELYDAGSLYYELIEVCRRIATHG